jgi:hypothetical protein
MLRLETLSMLAVNASGSLRFSCFRRPPKVYIAGNLSIIRFGDG